MIRWSRGLSAAVSVTTVLCLGACQSATAPVDLMVAAELSEEPLQSAAEVEIMITVTKTGEAAVVIPNPCDVGYRILNSGGELIASSLERGCAVQLETLRPGENLVVTLLWAAVEGYGVVGGSGDPLPPGTYTVVPVVIVDGTSIEGDVVSFSIT